MEIQIANRKAFYCNVKVLLLFFVIYGHLIEPGILYSNILMWQYRFIYAFHMPLFAFVSGIFLKTKKACIMQFKSALKYYVICQAVYMVVSFVVGNKEVSFFVPWWHLWYLLSLSFWAIICRLTVGIKSRRMRLIVITFAIIMACICGYTEAIGRFLSLSRTLCFLPYVLVGQMLPVDTKFSNYKIESSMGAVVAIIAVLIIAPLLPVAFFWQANSYNSLQIVFGAGFRLFGFIVAFCLGFFVLAWIPAKRMLISKAGTDTFLVYLLHGPVVRVLRNIEIDMELFVVIAPFMAAGVYLLIYELCRFKSKWCSISE